MKTLRRGAVLLAAALLSIGCKRPQERPAPAAQAAAAVVRVTRSPTPIKPDGEANEPQWNATATRTGHFVDTQGQEARPYSEGRFMWDANNLYVYLYAADNDIEAHVKDHDGPVWIDDAFALHIRPASADGGAAATYSFDINPAGTVTDARVPPGGKPDVSWESGIKLGVDLDGTLNDSTGQDDEEWVIEAAIPLASMGLTGAPGTRFYVDIGRCDTPRRTKERRCGAWGTPEAPKLLELAP